MLNKKYSRRRFMKSSAAISLGLTVGKRSFLHPQTNFKAVSRTSLKSLTTVPTTCDQCPAGCGIIACLNGNRLVSIYGNPDHPHNRGAICAKGIAGINLAADPERLLYPMKRIGTRGGGEWTRITWDEAYVSLVERIRVLHRENRTRQLILDSGRSDILLDAFINAVGIENHIDRHRLKNANRETAFKSMLSSPDVNWDVERSRTILNFGANPYANHDRFLSIARGLVRARVEKGARLITFDVRLSETASHSDDWIPVRSGTDGMIALAMAHVILDKGLADLAFVERSTNISPARLKRHLSEYTPEKAEKESGVKASKIIELAVEFASRKPSLAISGGGVSDHTHGTQSVCCIALLNWIVGSLDNPGGLSAPSISRFVSEALSLKTGATNDIRRGLESIENRDGIDTYMVCRSNPAYSDPDCASLQRLLMDEKRVPFLIVMDTHMTETAELADMVLPAATYLESWAIEIMPRLEGGSLLNLTQPAVSLLSTAQTLRMPDFETGKLLEASYRPRGESKDIGQMCLELSKRMGGVGGKKLAFKNTKDFVTAMAASIPGCDFGELKGKGFWIGDAPPKIKTAVSSQVRIHSRDFEERGHDPLPGYTPGILPDKDNEFILTSFKSNLVSESTANSKWVREIQHENRLWIHRRTAEKLKIHDGDKLKITSSAGSLTVSAMPTDRIHPRSVALAEGFGHTAVGRVAAAKSFKSSDPDTALIWWSKTGCGVNPNAIIENKQDPIGGGGALKDTLVRVEKA